MRECYSLVVASKQPIHLFAGRSYPDPENPSNERKEVVVKLRERSMLHDWRGIFIILTVSQDPLNYKDAPTEGIRRILEAVTGESIPRGRTLKTDKIGETRNTCSPNSFVPISYSLHFRLYSIIHNCRDKCPSRTERREARLAHH